MSSNADQRRRFLGMICLSLAAGMLLCGQTFLENSLQGVPFLIYWSACFFFTLASIVIALLDVRALRKQSTRMHGQMVNDTFSDLDSPSTATEPRETKDHKE